MGSRHENITGLVSDDVLRVSGTHEFTVRHYSQIKGIGVGRSVLSERFTVDGRAWTIGFYTDGYSLFDWRDPALFVQTVYSPQFDAFHAEFAFQLLDPDNGSRVVYECPSNVVRRFNCFCSSWGIRRFISRKQLEGEALGALRGDSLMIRCTVSVLKPNPRPRMSRVYPLTGLVPPSCFTENMVRFLATGTAPFDVKFIVDGVVLEAHRLVLASQSPWFERLLYGHWSSSDDRVVEIRGTSPETFKSMLHYIYNDRLPDTDEDMTRQLFVAADMYLLERLKMMCANRLCRFIQDGTVESIMELAEAHSCIQLQQACQSYLAH